MSFEKQREAPWRSGLLQHLVLRVLLYRNDSLPLCLVPFLDYCASRIFLRKVVGGYIFVHRMLMEYFAALEPTTEGTAKQRAGAAWPE